MRDARRSVPPPRADQTRQRKLPSWFSSEPPCKGGEVHSKVGLLSSVPRVEVNSSKHGHLQQTDHWSDDHQEDRHENHPENTDDRTGQEHVEHPVITAAVR